MYKPVQDGCSPRGFTIIELLVVVAVVSVLSAILVPSLVKVKRLARRIVNSANQKQITNVAVLFTLDNDNRYPESVATIGFGYNWNWQEPMMLTGYRARSPRLHRSMSEYLKPYIPNADIMYCTGSPTKYKYKYLQDAWDAGDEWDNPDTGPVGDPVSGTYCFYWNYTGYLPGRTRLFYGPRTGDGGHRQSKLLVSDYFGYDHHRSRNAFGSCEKFKGASITPGTLLSSPYWSRSRGFDDTLASVEIKLNAGYTDGHVESYSATDVESMKVIWKISTGEPYPEGIGPGRFYLPQNALH